MDLKDLQYWNHWKLQQLHASFQADFISFHRFIDLGRSRGTIFQAFWVLGHYFFIILVIIGCKGPLRRDRDCFLVFFYGFWVYNWRPSCIAFSCFLWFEQFKITFGLQSRFLMIFERKLCWILMSQPLKSIVNTSVFIKFHFFKMFVILMTSGTSWDLILDTFGSLGRPFWWFVGVLETHWNFIDFHASPNWEDWGAGR